MGAREYSDSRHPRARLRVLTISLLATIVCFAPLRAEASEGGFWFCFTPGGYGMAGDQKFTYPLALRLGGTINPHVRVGGEGYMAIVNADSWEAFGNLSGIVLVYPMASPHFFVKGGIGLAWAEPYGLSAYENTTCFGASFGTGYDFRLGHDFYVTPSLDVLWRSKDPHQGTYALDYTPAWYVTLGIGTH